jgi:hypothetical protein
MISSRVPVVARDIEKYAKVIKASGARPDQ